jgi:hypothetical protein
MKNLIKLLAKKSLWLTGLVFLLLSTATSPVTAQRIVTMYQARLSEADHYNTEGVRLWTIPAIIRQDRANFHYYGPQDYEDEWDDLYGNVYNRETLEKLLSNQSFSRYERRMIINGNPLIQVVVYPNYINVTVLEDY